MKKNKLWFRRKTYGWGWTPITWEGWLVTLIVLVIPICIRLTAKALQFEKSTQYFYTWASVPILLMALILVCFRWGEKPKWQWGIKRTKLSHVELNVLNYKESVRFYDLILLSLGWEKLISRTDHTTYTDGTLKIVLGPVEDDHKQTGYHRKRVGLNHLAFYAETKEVVDDFYREIILKNGLKTLYTEGATGDNNYYSLFFEDPDRIKLELVYSPFYCEKEYSMNNLEPNFDPYA
ncbi:MAG: VOC family protein [Rhizobacter sp.]|nr:VOC family protein [Bacteriovorax sp.]